MKLSKVILLLEVLGVIILQLQTGIASGSISVEDADAVRNSTLNTAPGDALDSTDASQQETFIDVYVNGADAMRDFYLSGASADALDSSDAPEQETFIDVYVNGADAMRDFDLSGASEDALDSSDAPEQETFIDVYVNGADAMRDFNLEPAEPITPGNNPPIASFTYSPENPIVGEEITFDASSSTDSDGEIISYEWDFGDETSGTGEVAVHSYSSAGDYTVSLTVTDDEAATDSISKTVSISIEGLLDVPFFSQRDPAWSDKKLNHSPYSIGESGCALTSAAMVAKYFGYDTDPDRLNTSLSEVGGLDELGELDWEKVEEVSNGKVVWNESVEASWSRIDQELSDKYPVISYVKTPLPPPNDIHFIVFIGKIGTKYYFLDPYDEQETINEWPNGAHGEYTIKNLKIYHGSFINLFVVVTKTKFPAGEIADVVLILEDANGNPITGLSKIEYRIDSESWKQERVKSIGPGVYAFAIQFPPVPGEHTLYVTANVGGRTVSGSDTFFVNYGSEKVPVVLVHDYAKDPSSLSLLKERLENDGFDVYLIDYSPGEPNCDAMGDIKGYAKKLSEEIEKIKDDTGADKVDIIGHGMGGLVARWYVEDPIEELGKNNNVRKLILLGTPNRGLALLQLPDVWGLGVPIPGVVEIIEGYVEMYYGIKEKCWEGVWIFKYPSLGKAMEQMYPCKGFISQLNYGDPEKCSGLEKLAPNVHYTSIAGYKGSELLTLLGMDPDNDGLVYVTDTNLWSLSPLDEEESLVDHKGVIEDEEVYAKIRERLQAKITESLATKTKERLQDNPVFENDTYEQNFSPPQRLPTIYGTIENTTKSHNLTLSFANDSSILLIWDKNDSNLDLVLTTPNGIRINSSVVLNGMNITYHPSLVNFTLEGYEIKNVTSGTWIADVIPINVSGNVNYTLITSLDTNLTLSALPNKYNYYPGEQINVTANLTYFNAPVANTSMTLKIARPDGKVENITLNKINESYSGTYNNTNITGQYGITATANGTLNETEFTRQTTTSLWVEQPPDLMVKNLSFSNSTPFIGDNVIINATIANIGDGNATNAMIEFYVDNPINGTLIGNETLDITSNSSEVVSMDWVAEYGTHKIYAVIPASNPFLEENYTNNIAFNSINVTGPVINLSLTMPVEVNLNDTFVVEALVENSGTELIGANATIILPSGLSTPEPLTIALGNISRNKTVNWNITANQTGLHEICINLTSANSQVYTSRKNISVVHIELSDLPTNLTCYQGGNITMDIQITNFNPNVSYVGLYLNTSVKDPSDNISSSINNISLLHAGETETLEILWNKTEKLGFYELNVSLFMGMVLIDNKKTNFEVLYLPAPPNVTSFTPESPVNDTVCNWRTFNVTVNQTVNVSWYLNGSLRFTNESITEANCTLHAEVAGEHNVSVIASNQNGTDIQTWIWNVTVAQPIITSFTITPDTGIASHVSAYNVTVNTTGFTSLNITIPAGFRAKTPSGGELIASADLWWNESDPHYGYVTFTANLSDPSNKMDVYADIGGASAALTEAVNYTEGAVISIKSPFGSHEERANLTLPAASAKGYLNISGLPDTITNVTVTIDDFVQNPDSAGSYTFTAKADGELTGKTATVTLNPLAGPPNITSFTPSSPVNDTEGATRTFNITINQTVNVSWQINGTEVQTNTSAKEAFYTNTSAAIGTWNVSAIATNQNGTAIQIWIWNVEPPSPCFIATATYGTPLHDDIDVLRDFRDEYLMTSPIGRTFVKIYYTKSPPIADVIRANEGLKVIVREGLVKPLVYVSSRFVG